MPTTTLERRAIGSLQVSLTGLGCNKFGRFRVSCGSCLTWVCYGLLMIPFPEAA